MTQSGLLRWADSVRMTMASDPGRKRFKEEVQLQGFSFLDDYLDNILYGAKQGPLIDLVKTPARKKAVVRKPKLASKLAQATTSLGEEYIDGMKENISPVNSFHQALLNAKDPKSLTKDMGTLVQDGPARSHSRLSEVLEVLPEAPLLVEEERPNLDPENVLVETHLAISTHVRPNELSVIAEDDEAMERSRTSIQIPANYLPQEDKPEQVASMQVNGLARSEISDEIPNSSRQTLSKEDVQMESKLSIFASFVPSPHLPSSTSAAKESEGPATVDITVPIRDPDVHSSSPKPSVHKAVLPTLPTLPEPMPLRKSMRTTRDPSVSSAVLGAITPGAAPAGKRTSWLIKAREVKAMEGVPKKSGSQPPIAAVSFGTKRKSEERANPASPDDEERLPKATKLQNDDIAPLKAASPKQQDVQNTKSMPILGVSEHPTQDGMLDLLKKKVQGLEARNDKHSGKAHGDAAITLAKIRAQAEAKIMERTHKEEEEFCGSPSLEPGINSNPMASKPQPGGLIEKDSRFSMSDLFPFEGHIKDRSKAPENVLAFQSRNVNAITPNIGTPASRESTSTTPPHSPPAQSSSFTQPTVPVFNKPPPVFVPPLPSARPLPTPPPSNGHSFGLPPLPAFSKPASMALGILPRLLSPPSNGPAPLSAQSTVETVLSDGLFDDRGDTQAWVPSTQDTEYSSAFGSQQQIISNQQNAMDEDDSWPIDKIPQSVHWPFGGPSKEDSMTWSTLPSQSQRVDTGSNSKGHTGDQAKDAHNPEQVTPESDGENMDIEPGVYNAAVELTTQDPELEELILSGTKSTVASTESKSSDEQASLTSSTLSQSQAGFFGQASRFLSSALGAGKKNKPEISKVMQKAAIAAKKQQQEDDKKAARLKEMENRRQLAMQRKVEEEKARQQERDRGIKEEFERRKREKEEQVEKKPLKATSSSTSLKREDGTMKQRKEDKLDKKQTSFNKTGFKPISSKQANILSSSAAFNSSQAPVAMATSTMKHNDTIKHSKVPTAIPMKGKAKPSPKTPVADEELTQPSQIIQTQMAARAKAAMQTEPLVPSENIELPEVNSEYSDSEDEDRPRTFNPPGWAQSPELRQALQAQSTINPDDIFGAIRPLRMEDMFKARTSRFRARTSSANWSGADRLTAEEEREYARRMGFK